MAMTKPTSEQITFTSSGVGATATTVQAKLRESVSVRDFGAVGDGTTDDTAAIQAAIDASANKRVYFPSGTYKLTAQLEGALSNVLFYGDGESSEITSDASQLWFVFNTTITNAVFEDLKFSSTKTGTNINHCIFTAYQSDVDGLVFNRCHFTCGLGGISALRVQPRIDTLDTGHTAKNVWITNNIFRDIGSVAITLLNRYVSGADPHLAFQNVWVEGNYCYNSGSMLTTTGYEGMFVSLDGCGTNFNISKNNIKHLIAGNISIENTGGWINGVVDGNTVDASGLAMQPYASDVSGRPTGYIVKNVKVSNNTFISAGSIVIGAHDNCVFSNNFVRTTSSIPIYVRYSNYNLICNNNVDATGVSGGAVQGFTYLQSTSTWNRFYENKVKTDGSGGANFMTCESGCTNNIAYNNYAESPALTGALSSYSTRTMTDANLDLSLDARSMLGYTVFSGTLTATRTVTLNAAALARNVVVKNNTAQSLVFIFTGAVNSATVTAGSTATLLYDFPNTAIRSY